MKFTSPAGWIQ